VVAVGEASGGQLAHRAAVALAERLGSPPVSFASDYGPWSAAPKLAETLHEVLSG
jgi:hypothetical protein